MIKLKLISFFFCIAGVLLSVDAQNRAGKLFQYFPAPGQHINIEQIGTPDAALKMAESGNNSVSLGSFGGYVILGFNQPCVNDPNNPYGIDFTIFGNAFDGSSEPGVVWVMKDLNRNGIPDDGWYEIAGSQHFHSKTKRNQQVTYFKTANRDVYWKSKNGDSGIIRANSFNLQPYFPLPSFFINYPVDSLQVTSTWIEPSVNMADPQRIQINSFAFGYADNLPKKQGVETTIPDNPNTANVEGAGGDPIDVDWSIDSSGKYVDLDTIHFVKISTSGIADLNHLGELSTDVVQIVDIEPNKALTGKDKLLVLYDLPAKILTGSSFFPESNYFIKGRKQNVQINYAVSDLTLAEINNQNRITAKKPGLVTISASAQGEMISKQIHIIQPDSIAFKGDFSSVYSGDTILIDVEVFDNEGEIVDIAKNITVTDTDLGKIIKKNDKFWFVALKSGTTSIRCVLTEFEIQKSMPIRIKSKSDLIRIFFSAKTESETFINPQWINVGIHEINGSVENRKNNYDRGSVLNLAHVINSAFKKEKLEFNFRDDKVSNEKLYLYLVERQGVYYYGWGGIVNPVAFAKCWVTIKNGKQYNNDFDKIQVFDGDTVNVFHAINISQITENQRVYVSKELKLYPNPVNNIFYIVGNINGADIEIYNSEGKKCLKTHCNSDKIEIHSELLKPGIYFGKIITSDLVYSLKFIKK